MHEMLTQRQARRGSAAIAALSGLALIQLPRNLAQARHVAALSGLLATGFVALAVVLAAAREASGGGAWRFVAAAGGLTAGGWALTRGRSGSRAGLRARALDDRARARVDYGRSLAMKSLLLCPVAWLALRNRRAIGGWSAEAAGRCARYCATCGWSSRSV